MTDLYDRIADQETLACPRCEGTYLHHGNVAVNVRDAEDGPGVQLLIQGQTATTLPLPADSPEWFGGRRGSIIITLECENCGLQAKRRIIQHKGETLLDWELP